MCSLDCWYSTMIFRVGIAQHNIFKSIKYYERETLEKHERQW